MVIGLALCPIWKARSLKPSESQRSTITKNTVVTEEVYQQLKVADKAEAAEVEALVGVFQAEVEAVDAPMAPSPMEWTANTSNGASTQVKCNRWVLKETPTSPRSAQRANRKYIW